MRKLHQVAVATACAISAIMLSGTVLAQATAAPAAAEPKKEESGKDIAFNNRKGNCLACHTMPTVPDALSGGLYGPPLVAMNARFPDKAKMRAKIWDATATQPTTSMIPFGKHGVLTEKEIDKVTDYIYGL